MDIFAKIFNGWKPLTIFTKMSILDGWQDSDYTNALRAKMKVATLKFLRIRYKIIADLFKNQNQ